MCSGAWDAHPRGPHEPGPPPHPNVPRLPTGAYFSSTE